jgi:hypothetical protein
MSQLGQPAMLWLSRKFLLGPQADGRAFKSTQRSVASPPVATSF